LLFAAYAVFWPQNGLTPVSSGNEFGDDISSTITETNSTSDIVSADSQAPTLPAAFLKKAAHPRLPLSHIEKEDVVSPFDSPDADRTTTRIYFSPRSTFFAVESHNKLSAMPVGRAVEANFKPTTLPVGLYLWRVSSGEPLAAKSSDCDYFSFPAAFCPEENELASVDGEQLRIWDISKSPASLKQTVPLANDGQAICTGITWRSEESIVLRLQDQTDHSYFRVLERSAGADFADGLPSRGEERFGREVSIDGVRFWPRGFAVTPNGRQTLQLLQPERDDVIVAIRDFRTEQLSAQLPIPRFHSTLSTDSAANSAQAGAGAAWVKFADDGSRMAISYTTAEQGRDTGKVEVKCWDTSSWKELSTVHINGLSKAGGTVSAFAFQGFIPGSNYCLGNVIYSTRTGRGDSRRTCLLIWDAASGDLVQEITIAEIAAMRMADLPLNRMAEWNEPANNHLISFSADGKLAFVGSTKQEWLDSGNRSESHWTLRAWEVVTGKEAFTIGAQMPTQALASLAALSGDGRILVSRGGVGNPRLKTWDVSRLVDLKSRLSVGDSKWQTGKRIEAASDYFTILGDDLAWVFSTETDRLWSRSVDAYLEMGRPDDARLILAYTTARGQSLSPESEIGKKFLAEYIQEENARRQRQAEEKQQMREAQLAELRAANQGKAISAANVTRKQFIDAMRRTMTRGVISELNTYAIFEHHAFQDVFGDPHSNIEWVDLKRLYGYRCRDGIVQVTVLVQDGTVFVSGIDQL
jgi:hypothetical protein